ncbi:hypothetical protein Gohar_007182 [Gossypium harknessii]|uniref:DUF4283 domain-containing protein n=1 Tax=Gossypium harknessii TaxID=34285 RepID=A0A7J9GFR2_9ROSI|nr:hypothetical protein [Gossypium harknessii]
MENELARLNISDGEEELDIDRVVKGAPWTFNNHLLVFHRLQDNENPMQMVLTHSFFWVQVHNLSLDFFFKVLPNSKARCEISAETPKEDPDLPFDSHLRKEGFSGSKDGLGHHVMNADKEERRQGGPPRRGVLGYVRQES